MLFKPLLGTALSGKMGGIVASHGAGGAYFRSLVIGTNPATTQQTLVRNSLANLVAIWQTLTQVQRDTWINYAANVPTTNRLGDQKFDTGQQWYVGVNTLRLQAGLQRNDICQQTFSLTVLTLPTVAPTETGGLLNVGFDNTNQWAIKTGGALLVYVGRDKSVTTNFFKGPYQLAGSILGDTTTPPTSPESTLVSPFPMTETNRLFVRFVALEINGLRSAEVLVGPTVIAA